MGLSKDENPIFIHFLPMRMRRLGFIFFFIFLKKVNEQSYYAKLFLIISEIFILDPRDQIRIFLFFFLFF